ncbi:efflux RND transporter periplasmic adaptor subunit [Sphingomonas sp. DT-207]|uniref:efflux RND transporter periplasmic adaptor subunit n=1 Tax=Sphingomonas sp. DT-207 TaxID=3396167 RepID=UPI003F1CC79C
MTLLKSCAFAAPLAALLAGCGAATQEITEPEPLPVEVVAARPGATEGAIAAVGRIAHQREMVLAFRVPGTIARLGTDIGDSIARGETLAELDARDLAARVAHAEGDVRRSERALARYAALNETGAVARASYEDERTALEQHRAALRAAAFDRSSARLVAPASGVVLERIAQAGETVAAGQAVLRVADRTSPLLVRVPVPEAQIGRVRIGAPARLTIAGRAEPVAGTVARTGARIDPQTGTAEVEVRLSTTAGLVSGMTGTVTIATGAGAASAVALPAEAVLEARGPRAAIFLYEPKAQRVRRREVRFMGFAGEEALVAGVPLDAQVVTTGAGFAADGQRVRVTGGAR